MPPKRKRSTPPRVDKAKQSGRAEAVDVEPGQKKNGGGRVSPVCGPQKIVEDLRELTGLLPDLLGLCNEYAEDVYYRRVPYPGPWWYEEPGKWTFADHRQLHTFAVKKVVEARRADQSADNVWFTREQVVDVLFAAMQHDESRLDGAIWRAVLGCCSTLQKRVADGQLKRCRRGPLS